VSERTPRRRWVIWSVVPSLLLIAVAVMILGRVREVERAADAYAAAVAEPERAPDAVEAYDALAWPAWFDQDVEPLGRGAAALVAGDLAAARRAFEEALAQSSGERRCRAVVNLVLTIEAQGDEIVELDAASARTLYLQARERIDAEPGCRRRRQADHQGAGDRLDRAAARLDAKLVDDSSDSTDQRPVSPEEVEPDQSDLDDLDRALDENADTRSKGPELEEGATDLGARPPHIPQW
jgi:tetratricopeptide (TPR) repeat protein